MEGSDLRWRGGDCLAQLHSPRPGCGKDSLPPPGSTRLARAAARFPTVTQLASPGRLQGSTCQCLSRARVAARQGCTRLARGSHALAKILVLLVLLTRRDCTLRLAGEDSNRP